MPSIDLRTLKVFMEVAQSRSMTLASSRLKLTQSAVSQSIQKLETDLGLKLIEKGKRPVSLTKAGELLEEFAGTLLQEASRLPHRLAEAISDAPPELRIGMVDTFAATAGPDLARHLMAISQRLVMWSGLTPSLAAALMNKEVEVIVTPDPLDDLDGLERFLLMTEPFIALLPAGRQAPTSWHELNTLAASLPLVRYSARSHTGRQIERHLRRLNLAIERRVEVDGSDALVHLIAGGAGWAISTPLCLLQGAVEAGRVAAHMLPSPGFSRSLYLVCRSDGPLRLAGRIAEMAIATLRTSCIPKLEMRQPGIGALIQAGQQPILDEPAALRPLLETDQGRTT